MGRLETWNAAALLLHRPPSSLTSISIYKFVLGAVYIVFGMGASGGVLEKTYDVVKVIRALLHDEHSRRLMRVRPATYGVILASPAHLCYN